MKTFDVSMLNSFFRNYLFKFTEESLGRDANYVGLIILSSLWVTGVIMIAVMFSDNKNNKR